MAKQASYPSLPCLLTNHDLKARWMLVRPKFEGEEGNTSSKALAPQSNTLGEMTVFTCEADYCSEGDQSGTCFTPGYYVLASQAANTGPFVLKKRCVPVLTCLVPVRSWHIRAPRMPASFTRRRDSFVK